MATAEILNIGKKLYEGKTKEVYELVDSPGKVLLQSKDQITAGNAARKNHLEGKAAISNKITSCIFQLLQEAGIKTAFTRKYGETAFIAPQCEMIPIEWVCRRIATGSFLKRNPGVKEGYKFYPPKVEMFFKDDANNDPQWSEEQLIAAKLCFAGVVIGQTEVDIMNHATQAIFEILEKSWLPQNCTLVDMKIEFGVDVTTKEIVLADVIDNDSWRLWPSGDRSQQKDKQSYRDLKEVTPEGLQMVKKNFEWVAERVELLLKSESQCRVVVLMGSTSDLGHCEKIKKACGNYGIPCELRVTSAHKGPDETLRIKAEYEGDGIPTVFVAVAGRSNGLGPVMSGNTAYPVISCPPLTPDWGAQDVWSSLRLPSGLGCSTILSPEGSAQFAAQIFGLNNHLIWAKLRASILNTWIFLKQADRLIESSLGSIATKFNFFIHNLAQLRFSGLPSNDEPILSFSPKTYSFRQDGRIKEVSVFTYHKKYNPDKHYIYVVRILREGQLEPSFVFRTFDEFQELHNKLSIIFPLWKLPGFPNRMVLGRTHIKDVAAKRKVELNSYLQSLMSASTDVAECDLVCTFFHPLIRDEKAEGIARSAGSGPFSPTPGQIGGAVKLSVSYRNGTLFIMVMHIKDLVTEDGADPNPYVKTYLLPDTHKTSKRKTKTSRKTRNPTFNEMLVYNGYSKETLRQRELQLSVLSAESLRENFFLGGITLPLKDFNLSKETVKWYQLTAATYL